MTVHVDIRPQPVADQLSLAHSMQAALVLFKHTQKSATTLSNEQVLPLFNLYKYNTNIELS